MGETMEFVTGNLLLADFVRASSDGGKKDLYGVISGVSVEKFPATLMGAWFIWQATIRTEGDSEANADLVLRVRKPDGSTLDLIQFQLRARSEAGAGAVEVAQHLPALVFDAPGLRVFEVWCGSILVASTGLNVRQIG